MKSASAGYLKNRTVFKIVSVIPVLLELKMGSRLGLYHAKMEEKHIKRSGVSEFCG